MSKHSRVELRDRMLAFKQMLKENPPEMPTDFTHKDYRRVIDYARVAFCTGWNSGMNYLTKGGA